LAVEHAGLGGLEPGLVETAGDRIDLDAKAGTAKAWITSAPVVWTRITLLTGTTISLSTPSSRGCLSCAISESNSNLPLSG